MKQTKKLYIFSKQVKQADCSHTKCKTNICYCNLYKNKGLGSKDAIKYTKTKKVVPSTFPLSNLKNKYNKYYGKYIDCYSKPCKIIKHSKVGSKVKCNCKIKKGAFVSVIKRKTVKSNKKSKKNNKSRRTKRRHTYKKYINGADIKHSAKMPKIAKIVPIIS